METHKSDDLQVDDEVETRKRDDLKGDDEVETRNTQEGRSTRRTYRASL